MILLLCKSKLFTLCAIRC
uniref:Uncharacterized protein n=1 Tax=Arundo donax TaxID=35708 RepID=A0A0A8XUY5_ARUDO